ncbi:hypothetical protein MASR2M36_05640 [Providencia sp.]
MEFKLTSVFYIFCVSHRRYKDIHSVHETKVIAQAVTGYPLSFQTPLQSAPALYVRTSLSLSFPCVIPNSGPPEQASHAHLH